MLLAPAASAAEGGKVAIVLGAGSAPEGWANPLLVQRVCRGVQEYRAGRARTLLMTGGYTAGHIAEAEMMRAVAVAAGVPPGRVWKETSAVNTIENAVFSTSLARRKGVRRALLVSHRAHLSRARADFERAGGDFWTELEAVEADGTPACLPTLPPLALAATVEMLVVDVTEVEPFDAILSRSAEVPSPALVEDALSAAATQRGGAARRLYFAEPQPSTSTFAAGAGAAHGHISRTELARILASAAGVAWDEIYISSGRRLGQIPGAVEPTEDPWLRIPGARLAVRTRPAQRAWWERHLSSGLNALLPRPQFLER